MSAPICSLSSMPQSKKKNPTLLYTQATRYGISPHLKVIKTEKVEELRIDSKTGAIYFLLEKEKERSVLDIDIDFINNL